MVTLHSSVIDFKFHSIMQQPSLSSKKVKIHSNSDDEENTTFMENGILVEKKVKPVEEEPTEDPNAPA